VTSTLPAVRTKVAGARAWQTLFITSIAMFLVSMDVTIVSVALPGIRHTFRSTSEATLSWSSPQHHLSAGQRGRHRHRHCPGRHPFAIARGVGVRPHMVDGEHRFAVVRARDGDCVSTGRPSSNALTKLRLNETLGRRRP
jgi:hypothetical protein